VKNNRKEDLPFSMRGKSLLGQEMFKVLDKARRLEEEGIHIYHLELGNPRLQPPEEIIDACVSALKSLDVGYTSSAGHPSLRRALTLRYARSGQRAINMENVVISPANVIISQFLDLTCDRGDRVVLFTPAFPSYLAAATHIGLDVVGIALQSENGYDLTEQHIEAAISACPKAVIVNSANNPTGAVYSREILEHLALECHRHGIWLLSDETYGELCFGKMFYSLFPHDYPRLVIMSSFSKIFSIPGFRVGFSISHESVAEKLALSNSTLFSCLSAFAQLGCAAGLQVLDKYSAAIREYFAQRARECSNILNTSGSFRCMPPQSGFYIFLDIGRTGLDDFAFSARLLEEWQTAVTPGRSFGASYATSIRLATCGKYEDVIEGTHRVVRLAQELSV